MLSPEEVAKDEEIFRPDGFIMFPRSDGDPTYGPTNTVLPPKTDLEVNYYHIFRREERRHDTWRTALGEQLATYFKLPLLSRSKVKWKLYDFPQNYLFTEQRKGPANDPRTDPYLFGSQAHRFRSTKEAFDHLLWLLLDPDMDPANCRCKYCHKGPRASTGDGTARKAVQPNKRKSDLMSASTAATAGRRGRKSLDADGNEVQNETSITIRDVAVKRLVPGVTIASVPQRDQEVMHELKRGEKERFRVGELVWCELDEPVVDPTEPQRSIAAWPAVILDPAIEFTTMLGYFPEGKDDRTNLEIVSAPGKRAESPPGLNGSVHQIMAYKVAFFGTMEEAKVPESSLTPYLADHLPTELIDSELGMREDHPWLFQEDGYPHLNLSRQPGLPPPEFTKSIVAFGYAVEAAAVLRSLYNLTDAYSGSDTPEEVLRDLGPSTGNVDGEPPQGLRYYQGLYFGFERIWVGEVVRLKLSTSDIKKLQRQLNATLVADKEPSAPDPAAIILDEDGSYVLRLAAIYEDPRAPKTARVSGEIFQIMPTFKYNAIKAEVEARIKKLGENDSLDAAARQEEEERLKARLPQPSILAGKPGFPPMPQLPPGFVMISLSERLHPRIPREISLSIGHIAGRIYPSLGMHSDAPRVAEQIKQRPTDRKLAADEDSKVDVRMRLSVAGLLSGCVKAMRGGVQTWTRTTSFRGALALARARLNSLFTGEFDEAENETESASPTKSRAKKARTSGLAADAAATVTVQAGQIAPPNASGGVPSEASPAQQQVSQAPQLTLAEQVASKLTAAADAETVASSEDEPPLPPGWVLRKSRNLGSWYYVHTETKKTQWERPTL